MKFAFGILLATSLLLQNVEASIPKCSDCSVYATANDGTLWGWENDSFCKISSKCNKTTKKKSTTKKATSTKKSTTKKVTTTKKTTTTKKATTSESKETTASTPAPHEKDENGNLICNGCVVTATGGNSSLWGWEDEKSCIIDQKKCEGKIEEKKSSSNGVDAESTHKKNAAGNLICNECNVTATGGDGSYWGWEDEASCVIDNVKCNLEPPKTEQQALERGPDGILICKTCEYTRIDPDTTTWNTENGEDCRVIGSRCGINTTPHPWCSGCIVTGTGNDGALYGWENEASCLINEVSCGIISNNGKYGEASNSPSTSKFTYLYVIMASLAGLYYIL